MGAWARLEQDRLVLEACVVSVDGSDYIRERAVGSPGNAEELGRELSQMLLAAGADRILRLAGRNVGDH
jgi:hydroxymethylbilane synthase